MSLMVVTSSLSNVSAETPSLPRESFRVTAKQKINEFHNHENIVCVNFFFYLYLPHERIRAVAGGKDSRGSGGMLEGVCVFQYFKL